MIITCFKILCSDIIFLMISESLYPFSLPTDISKFIFVSSCSAHIIGTFADIIDILANSFRMIFDICFKQSISIS